MYADVVQLISEKQADFRRGHSITVHNCSLYSLIQLFKLQKMKLCCAFIDSEKAFDSILAHRNKVFLNSIDGKCSKISQICIKAISQKFRTMGLSKFSNVQ